MKFVDWESRQAVMSGGRAWAVLAPGEGWMPVDSAEVGDFGIWLPDEAALRDTFSLTFGRLPDLPMPSPPPNASMTENPVRPLSEVFSTLSARERRQLVRTGVALAHLDARMKSTGTEGRANPPASSTTQEPQTRHLDLEEVENKVLDEMFKRRKSNLFWGLYLIVMHGFWITAIVENWNQLGWYDLWGYAAFQYFYASIWPVWIALALIGFG